MMIKGKSFTIRDRGFPLLVGDVEGLFMHTHRVAADYLADRLGNIRILEICCGIGAITSAFSKKANYVVAVDAHSLRIKCAEINVQTYGDPNRVKFQVADAFFETLWKEARPDVVFADPDWAKQGDIKSNHTSVLKLTQPPVPALIEMANQFRVPSVVLRLAPVSDTKLLENLASFELERIFIDGSEKYWFVYFGSVCNNAGSSAKIELFNE